MIAVAELRLGNLVTWNPSLANPASTLSPMIVEVAAILPNQVGYVSANIGQRVEPFEDDLIQKEPIMKDAVEFEAIPLTPEILAACKQQLTMENWNDDIKQKLTYLHQFQNFHFVLAGEELVISNLSELMNAD